MNVYFEISFGFFVFGGDREEFELMWNKMI